MKSETINCHICGIYTLKYCEKHKGYHHDILRLKSKKGKEIKDKESHSVFEFNCEQGLIAWQEETEAYGD